jgi:hypothetical protein
LGRRRINGKRIICGVAGRHNAILRPRTARRNPTLAQIVQNAARVALEGRAISAAASRMRHDKFAGFERYAVALLAITPALLGLSERVAAAAARAHRVIDCPIGCVEHLHRVALDRTKLTVD